MAETMKTTHSPRLPLPRRVAPALVLLTALALLPQAATAWGSDGGFPLTVAGRTLAISANADRDALAKALAEALPGIEPSVGTPERLQYDYQAAPDQAPLSIVLDFGPKGRLSGVTLDAMTREQNPAAAALAAWLAGEAGPGVRKGRTTVWNHAGFRFALTLVPDAGEDSAYRMEATPR